jgi:hypothetical protein
MRWDRTHDLVDYTGKIDFAAPEHGVDELTVRRGPDTTFMKGGAGVALSSREEGGSLGMGGGTHAAGRCVSVSGHGKGVVVFKLSVEQADATGTLALSATADESLDETQLPVLGTLVQEKDAKACR